jgi:hypothetical protein
MWQLQMHAFWQQNFISSLGPRGLLNHPPALKMAICLNQYSFVKMTNSYHNYKCFLRLRRGDTEKCPPDFSFCCFENV